MNRTLMNRLIRTAGRWAFKQVLSSLPVIGYGFKLYFIGAELLRVVQEHVEEEAEPVPLLVRI